MVFDVFDVFDVQSVDKRLIGQFTQSRGLPDRLAYLARRETLWF